MGSILTINPGSSSIKAALFSRSEHDEVRKFHAWNESVQAGEGFEAALRRILDEAQGVEKPSVVGCRVVDGGPDLEASVLVDDSVMRKLEAAAELAPLHSGESIAAIRAVQDHSPDLPIVVAFDTGFHRTLTEVASTYAIPRALSERYRIRRFGFHGLAYRSVVRALRGVGLSPQRLVACQLGSGSSVCAIQDGLSVDTTMGFTPLEGLVMGTRSGSLDPGLILFLLKQGFDSDRLSHLLNRESGLLGLSGTTADVRQLEAAKDERSELALQVFSFSAAKHIASMAVSMGGLDALSFSGGIGEHSAQVRRLICRQLEFLGFRLDRTIEPKDVFPLNIALTGSKPIWIVPADEDREIALDSERLVVGKAPPATSGGDLGLEPSHK